MKRDKRKNATELSVFIKIKEDGQYEIVDPCTDGEGIPVILFTSIINALGKAVESYNEKRKNKKNVSTCPVCGSSNTRVIDFENDTCNNCNSVYEVFNLDH